MLFIRNDKFILKKIMDNYILFPTSEMKNVDPILFNELSAFVWEHLNSVISEEELLNLILTDYDVAYEEAHLDLEELIKEFKKNDLIYCIGTIPEEKQKHLLYFLDNEEFKQDFSKIGDIMDDFLVELYNKTKLKLGLISDEILKEIYNNSNNETSNLQIIHEEFLHRNLTNEEISEKILTKVKESNGINSNVVIIDPFLLHDNSTDYIMLLRNILKNIDPISLTIITNPNYCEEAKEMVENEFFARIINNNEFHDRFWIFNNNKGFLLGTSLNGIGKKYTTIQTLENSDIKDICDIIEEINGD